MKTKVCCLLSAACLFCGSAFADPSCTYDGEMALNGAYIRHGRKEGGTSGRMHIEAELSLPSCAVYGGLTSINMFEDDAVFFYLERDSTDRIRAETGSLNQVAPGIGLYCEFLGSFCADVGYAAHYYSNLKTVSQFLEISFGNKCEKFSNEVYAGLAMDVIFSPRVYVSYDINLRELDVCASGTYAYDLGHLGLDRAIVEGGLHVGFDSTQKPFCIDDFFEFPELGYGMRKHYTYYGGELSLCYRHSPNLTFRLSGHYDGNSAPKDSWANGYIGAEASEGSIGLDLKNKNRGLAWLSAAMAFSF
ncbi:MAG: hypothetical protein LBF24_02435 [Puniceicoccales bacterium]|jgi:hypothetical protein|nr:hypothetical protein [Puniceicoccales bacterium]